MRYAKLNRLAFAVTAGVFWAFGVLFLTLWAAATSNPGAVDFLTLYPGYGVSAAGAIAGFAWGLLDGFAGGFVFAALYNYVTWLLSMRKRDRAFVASRSREEERDSGD